METITDEREISEEQAIISDEERIKILLKLNCSVELILETFKVEQMGKAKKLIYKVAKENNLKVWHNTNLRSPLCRQLKNIAKAKVPE